jgi:L-alanine-DL-glutamate epimerase-like enolase superfamily enzyme
MTTDRLGLMKITRLEHLHADGGWRVFSFLKVVTDDGLVGWAEYNEGYGAGGLTALIRKFADVVIGMDPREVGRNSAKLHAMTRLSHGGLNAQAIAIIENACLDIKAKALGVPVYALFGGPFRTRIPLYWSHCGSRRVWRRDLFEAKWGYPPLRSLDDIAALGRTVIERGFKALKTNPCDLMPGWTKFSSGFRPMASFLDRRPDNRIIGEMTQLLRAFRDSSGPDTGLMFDLNFNQRADGFIRIARALEPFNLTWLEIDSHDPGALSLVRRSSRTPIGSLESIHGLNEYRPFLEQRAVDVAIIDVHWNGLWESTRIATLADAYDTDVAPHNYEGHLASMVSAHFCACVPNFRIMEIEVDDVPWKDELVTHVPVIENGELVLSERPGWGTEVNEKAAQKYAPTTAF